MKKLILIIALGTAATLTGCADYKTLSDAVNTTQVGFWHGIWHGMIIPIAWLVSLFNSDTTIYAIYNNGGWYNFGFFLGVGVNTFGCSGRRV